MTKFKSFDEIVETEWAFAGDEDKKALAAAENSYMFHHGYGTYIRNEYKLWHEGNPLTSESRLHPLIVDGIDMSPSHPDAISNDIIVELMRRAKEYGNT